MTPEERARLRELCAKTTPGPWRIEYNEIGDLWRVCGRIALEDWTGGMLFDDGSADGEYGARCSIDTRDLIVTAVNALPALLDALDSAEAEIEKLKEAVKWYRGTTELLLDAKGSA